MQVRSKTLQLLGRYVDEPGREPLSIDSEIGELGPDSLAMFEVVYELEEHFAVDLDEHELARVKTVRDLVGHVERKASGD